MDPGVDSFDWENVEEEYAEEYGVDDSGNATSHFQITNTYQDIPWDYMLDLKWDSDDHLDVPDGFGGRWDYSDGVNQIKISNDSNAQLKYYVTYASEIPSVSMDIQARTQDESGVLEPMSTGGRTLKACSSTSVEESTDLIFVTPSGTIPDNIVEEYKDGRDLEVGTLTVTFVTNQS